MGGRPRRLDLTQRAAHAVVLTAALVLTARQTGVTWLFLPTLVAAVPLLAVPLAAATLVLAVARRRVLAAVGALCVALICAWWLPVFTPGPTSVLAASEEKAPKLRVMAFNSMASPETGRYLVAAVVRERADVLVVSECGPALRRALVADGIEKVLPHRVGTTMLTGVMVWSRVPMHARGAVALAYGGEVVDISGFGPAAKGRLRLLAAHPMSPRWREGAAWAADQRALLAAANWLPDSAVIAGDLNMTRDHAPFRALQGRGFVDALDATGSGWQPTWTYGPNGPGLATIDHILGRGVGLADYRTIRIPGSDHRAVAVTVSTPTALG